MTQRQVADLTDSEAEQLALWLEQHEGDTGFVPQAIRRLPLDTKLELATDSELDAAWR